MFFLKNNSHFLVFQMCHQTLQDAQCARARLYLWPVVQTKGKVTPLFRAAVNASPGEQMGVCSMSGPLHAVLQAPTALEGARGDVCALLRRSVWLCCVVLEPQMSKSGSWLRYQQRFHACIDPSEMWQFSGLLTCRNILTPTQACSAL